MQLEPARRFVNRQDALGAVDEQIRNLTAGLIVRPAVLSFFGVPGIGKTALLAEIWRRYEHERSVATVGFSLKALPSDLDHAKHEFLQRFQRGGADRLHIRPFGAAVSTSPAELDQALVNVTQSLGQLRQPLLLLIDAWEEVPEALFAWVERLLLLPLLQSNRVFCVLGSQGQLRFRQFEVRRQVRSAPLHALDLQATTEQLGRGSAIGRAVYELTFGHPLANETVHRNLPGEGAAPREVSQALSQQSPRIANEIVQMLQERVIGGLSPELVQVFRVIALFREFDIHTLRSVLPQFYPGFERRSDSALLLMMKQLLDTRLVSWNDETRAYQLHITIRQILTRALELGEPEHYRRVREAAIAYYQQLIHDVPGNRSVYVVEFFFQRLYKGGPVLYNAETLTDELGRIVDRYYYSPQRRYRDDEGLVQLRARFAADDELHRLLAEHETSNAVLDDLLVAKLAEPLAERGDPPSNRSEPSADRSEPWFSASSTR